MEQSDRSIVVIGAGLGGLSAAIRLAAAGFQVRVLEQNAEVGGKMGRFSRGGFTWDTGPSVITMQPALEALFKAAGRSLSDYVTLVPVEPITRYFYPDGTVLDATRDLPRMARQIAALDERDVEGFLGFLAHAAALNRITGPVFIQGPPPTPWDILRVPLRDMLQVDAWRTMDAAIRRWVRDPHLRMLLGRYATYVGASPYQAPAVLNTIAHTELTQGVVYARGGIYTLAEAYAQLARELGVEIRTDRRVTEILLNEDHAVTGVRLVSAAQIPARTVVANVDVTTVYHDLLPDAVAQGRSRRLARRQPSLSGFILLLGIEGHTEGLIQHNVLFPRDYRREFTDIFQRGVPPESPTIYVTITSRQDPEHAPAGCENWFVLVNVPPLGPGIDWADAEAPLREMILERLAEMGFDVHGRVVEAHTITPQDLAQRTGAWRGSLYGISSNQPLNALRRPHPRSPIARGLYFVGGTTHPGGGIPMVTRSGAMVAEMIREDLSCRTA